MCVCVCVCVCDRERETLILFPKKYECAYMGDLQQSTLENKYFLEWLILFFISTCFGMTHAISITFVFQGSGDGVVRVVWAGGIRGL